LKPLPGRVPDEVAVKALWPELVYKLPPKELARSAAEGRCVDGLPKINRPLV
jgi:hypothetical protein